MSDGLILVTGATGQVGHATARALLGAGARVRVLVRDPERAGSLAGAEVVPGSFEDAESLHRATDGAESMLIAGRDGPDQVTQHDALLRAARANGVGHVVKLSAIGASPDSPVELMRHHGILEDRIRASFARPTTIRPHLFLQNLLRSAEQVRDTGRLRAPMGQARPPMVDTRDVGEAIAAVLADPGRHAGATYALTGPAPICYGELATALTEVAGRRVAYEPVAPPAYERELLAAGVPGWRAFDLAHIASAYSGRDSDVSPDLGRLLGREPRSLVDFLADHRDAWAVRMAGR